MSFIPSQSAPGSGKLSKPEQDELKNIMLNEPVFAGDTISHHTAGALKERGLIHRNPTGEWVADWDAIRVFKP